MYECGETTAPYEGGDFCGSPSPATWNDEHIKCKLTLPALLEPPKCESAPAQKL